jgi:hypothetical protein
MFPMAIFENTLKVVFIRSYVDECNGFWLSSCILLNLDYAGMHGKFLEFCVRLEIAIDVAHAITYLHTYSGNLELLLMFFVTLFG